MYFIGKLNVLDTNPYKKNLFKTAQIAIVKGIRDEYGFGRIQVDIPATPSIGGTGREKDDKGNIKYTEAIPLIPKHLSVIPKVGEAVIIFAFEGGMTQDYFYIGPLISSLDFLKFDDGSINARRMLSYGMGKINPPVTSVKTNSNIIPDMKGVFSDPEDITIQGRYNTDIIQKENEVLIRAGKFTNSKKGENNNPYDFKFNKATQGFINIAAHPIPFGDILLDMLKLLKKGITSHVHSSHGKKAEDIKADGNERGVMETFEQEFGKLEKTLLSKNIRIN